MATAEQGSRIYDVLFVHTHIKVTHSKLLVCGHAEKDHKDSAMNVPQRLLYLQWKVQLLIIAPGRSEVRGQGTQSQVTMSTVILSIYSFQRKSERVSHDHAPHLEYSKCQYQTLIAPLNKAF